MHLVYLPHNTNVKNLNKILYYYKGKILIILLLNIVNINYIFFINYIIKYN